MISSKYCFLLFSLFFFSFVAIAQIPEGINYQATVRNNSGDLLTNSSISVVFEIIKGNVNGSIAYQENHSLTTNALGGFNTVIGTGNATVGSFNSVEWGNDSYFLRVLVNGNDLGTSQLMSVPYALYAKTSGSKQELSISGSKLAISNGNTVVLPDADDQNEIQLLSLSNDTLYLSNGGFAVLPSGGLLEEQQDVVRLKKGYDSMNFVIGSPQMNYDGVSNHNKRMFFNKEKGAFRVGGTGGLVSRNWDVDSIGEYSFASGYQSKASGDRSIAMGQRAYATGIRSTSIGNGNDAIGISSTALGSSNTATGEFSVANGFDTRAEGDLSSTLGYRARSKGYGSISLGYETKSHSPMGLVVGCFNDTIIPVRKDLNSYSLDDPLFIIGNGIQTRPSNALVVNFRGNVGVGINEPDEKLHLNGKIKFGSFETFGDGGTFTIETNSHIVPETDNSRDLGSSSRRWDDIYATNGVIQTSDITQKTNIKALSYGIADLMKIETISYNWKDDVNSERKIGFNAQNLQGIIPEVVVDEEDIMDEESGKISTKKSNILGVRYADMIPVLTKSIQEQQALIDKQHAEISALKAEMEELQSQLQLILQNTK
jgi:hypothetical protein